MILSGPLSSISFYASEVNILVNRPNPTDMFIPGNKHVYVQDLCMGVHKQVCV